MWQTVYPFIIFFLAQTSVYSNIIFCEVSWGEKQFGRPHCNLIHSPCWTQQTPHVPMVSILETHDRCLISSAFCLQASLYTFPFNLSPSLRRGTYCFLSHLLSLPLSIFNWTLSLSLASSLPSNSLALLFCLSSETSLLCPSHKTKQTKTLGSAALLVNYPAPKLPSLPDFWSPAIASTFVSSTHFNLVPPPKLLWIYILQWCSPRLCSSPLLTIPFCGGSLFIPRQFSNQSFCLYFPCSSLILSLEPHPPKSHPHPQVFHCSILALQGTCKR